MKKNTNVLDQLLIRDPFIVAEAGAAHGGNGDAAIELVQVAIKSGADAVTFQEIDDRGLYSIVGRQHIVSQNCIGWEALAECRNIAKANKLFFSVCVTDIASLDTAMNIGIDFIKIVSYDITFFPFLEKCADSGLPIFLSTGASTFEEVRNALAHMNADDRVVLYHTDCGYPTKDEEVNLRRMTKLKEEFGVRVGYCDHTNHCLSSLVAVAMGASVIEKHYRLTDRPHVVDAEVSLMPDELGTLCSELRRIPSLLGTGGDVLEEGDLFRRHSLRRGLAASNDIAAGEIIRGSDLTMLRPPTELTWDDLCLFVGKVAKKDIKARQHLTVSDVDIENTEE